jgi:hypothetical protein
MVPHTATSTGTLHVYIVSIPCIVKPFKSMYSLYSMYCEPPGHQGGHQGAHSRKCPLGGSSRYRWRSTRIPAAGTTRCLRKRKRPWATRITVAQQREGIGQRACGQIAPVNEDLQLYQQNQSKMVLGQFQSRVSITKPPGKQRVPLTPLNLAPNKARSTKHNTLGYKPFYNEPST